MQANPKVRSAASSSFVKIFLFLRKILRKRSAGGFNNWSCRGTPRRGNQFWQNGQARWNYSASEYVGVIPPLSAQMPTHADTKALNFASFVVTTGDVLRQSVRSIWVGAQFEFFAELSSFGNFRKFSLQNVYPRPIHLSKSTPLGASNMRFMTTKHKFPAKLFAKETVSRTRQ